jgi:hypothetical protein
MVVLQRHVFRFFFHQLASLYGLVYLLQSLFASLHFLEEGCKATLQFIYSSKIFVWIGLLFLQSGCEMRICFLEVASVFKSQRDIENFLIFDDVSSGEVVLD